MLKKVFIITMLGEPFPWIQQYIDGVQHLEKYGWYWKIFTPAKLESKGNVEVVPMNADQFNDLYESKLGVRPQMAITPKGIPSVHVTDFYTAAGFVFADWLMDADFWGITNLDVVYGNLSTFLPDSVLKDVDVMTDDIDGVVNGVFSLWRNVPRVNDLFREDPRWKDAIGQGPCPRCTTGEGNHFLYGTDEYWMTDLLKKQTELTVLSAPYYPFHSHDRLENHIPEIKLKRQTDGSLWELLADIKGPQWIHARPFIGREILYYHFQKTKTWPKCL